MARTAKARNSHPRETPAEGGSTLERAARQPTLQLTFPSGPPLQASWRLFLLAMLYAAVFAGCVFRWWRPRQQYPDVITGAITWGNISKTSDYIGLSLIAIGTVLAYWGLLRLARFILQRAGGPAHWLTTLLNVPVVLLAYWVGAQLVGFDIQRLPLESLLSSFVLFLALPALVRLQRLSPRMLQRAGLLLMFDLLCLLLGGFGIAFLFAILFPFAPVNVSYATALYALAGVTVLGVLLLRCTSLCQCVAKLTKATYFLQAPTALLFLAMLRRAVLYHGQRIAPTNRRPLLALLAILCLAAWISLYRRYRRCARYFRSPLRAHVEPLCLAAVIACFIAMPAFPTITGDDFHFGEQYIPWQQLTQFGRIPYVDLIPIHGLMAFATGALNALLFDGTVATFGAAGALLGALAGAVTFFCLYRSAGLAPALLFCLVVNHLDRLYLVGPVLLCLEQPKWLQSGRMWFSVIALCLLSVAYNIPVGLALIIGLLPTIIDEGLRAWRRRLLPWRRAFIGAAASLCIVLAIPIVRRVGFGFVRFAYETASTNTVAHGIQWEGFASVQPPAADAVVSPLLFELFKFGWVFIALFAVAILIAKGRLNPSRRASRLLWGVALTCLVMAPWTINRIGSGLSRSGSLSAYCAAVFLPLLAIRYVGALRHTGGGSSALPLIGALLGVYAVFTGSFASLQNLSARLQPAVTVPDNLLHVKGSDAGLPNLGDLYMPQDRLDAILRFHRTVSAFVGESGTYFDLSNRQALYSFTRRREPVLYATPYIAVSHQQQERVLKQLSANPPQLVYVAPAMNFDGPASLRSYLLYRYAVLRYRPCKVAENIFLLAPSLNPGLCENVPPQQLLNSNFALWNLAALPSAWGGSWRTLRSLFITRDVVLTSSRVHLDGLSREADAFTVPPAAFDEQTYLDRYPDVANAVKAGAFTSGLQHYETFGRHEGRNGAKNSSFELDVRDLNIDPKRYDFLTFRFAFLPNTARPIFELRWTSDVGASTNAISFILEGDRAVIPLGSYPEWLMANRITSLRFTIPSGSGLKTVRLFDFQFLHYRPSEATDAIARK